MINIDKKDNSDNIDRQKEILVFLNDHLTNGYTEVAKERLRKNGVDVSTRTVYAVKSGNRTNWRVLEVLAEIASENKAAKEKVEDIMSNN